MDTGDDVIAGALNVSQDSTALLVDVPQLPHDYILRVGQEVPGECGAIRAEGTLFGLIGSAATDVGTAVGVTGSGATGVRGDGTDLGGYFNSTYDWSIGLIASCAPQHGFASAAFTGGAVAVEKNLIVGGDLYVTGQKITAVPHPDGKHRSLYPLESPEGWFEDFGEARLKSGKAKIKIDPDFAAVITRTTGYHVFLTACGACNGLYVSRRSKAEFEVRELQNGKSDVPFCYRIVGRRKDIKTERLAPVLSPKEFLANVGAMERRPLKALKPKALSELRKLAEPLKQRRLGRKRS